MLEFKKNRYGNWAAAVGKWHFQINQTRVGTKHDPKPFWVLAARGSKNDVKNLNTGRHRRFETMEAAADALAKWIRANSAAIEAHRELETALRWASCYNRPLFQRFNRTKKKRIRKKYAKRVLEWYRTEVVANDLRNI